MKNRHICIFFFLLLFGFSSAQQMEIKNFYWAENDLTASMPESEIYDQNNQRCALVKIETTLKGLYFDVGALGVTKVDDNHVGEVWVYVPHGVMRITIQHPQYGTIRDYYFNLNIISGRTYIMQLVVGGYDINDDFRQQYVVFNVRPRTASIEFDGEYLENTDGTAKKMMPFGRYYYRVELDQYHSEAGYVLVNSVDKRVEVNVTLAPAFGWLQLTGTDINGGTVYVDKKNLGTAPLQRVQLPSGKHSLRIIKKLYSTYENNNVIITDSQTTVIRPVLKADFASITFNVDNNAYIYINDKYVGISTATVDLETGIYKVETRLTNHKTAQRQLSVNRSMNGQTINLATPVPIVGRVAVNSNQINADIYLDGKKVGQTPMILSRVLIGEHTIRLSKEGYADATAEIKVAEGQTQELKLDMQNMVFASLNVNDNSTTIYIKKKSDSNYKFLSTGSWSGNIAVGDYVVKCVQSGFDDSVTHFSVNSSNKHINLNNPTPQFGTLSVVSSPSEATVWIDNRNTYNKTPCKIKLSPGNHTVKVYKEKYKEPLTKTIYLSAHETQEIDFKLSSNFLHGNDYHPDNYFETFYGFGFDTDFRNFDHYVGLNYTYLPKRFGFNVNAAYGITRGRLLLMAGPNFRLNKFSSATSVQLQLAAGGGYNIPYNSFLVGADLGFRFGFESSSNFAWYSFSLGSKYIYDFGSSHPNNVIPYIGVSLIPLRGIVLLAELEEEKFPSNFLEATVGYCFGESSMQLGFSYTWLYTHLGAYGSMLFNLGRGGAFNLGPAIRLTPDYCAVDLQLYQGVGYSWSADGLGGETGIRMAFKNPSKSGNFSWFSMSFSTNYSGSGVGIQMGLSIGILGILSTAGLGALFMF